MSTFIGLGATSSALKLFPYTSNTASMAQWSAFIYDTSVSGNTVKAPAGDAPLGFAGFLADNPGTSGTAVGVVYNFARMPGDKIPALIVASATVTVGNALVIANTSGHLRAYVNGSDDDVSIVAYAEQTMTAGGTAEICQVRIAAFDVHKDNA